MCHEINISVCTNFQMHCFKYVPKNKLGKCIIDIVVIESKLKILAGFYHMLGLLNFNLVSLYMNAKCV